MMTDPYVELARMLSHGPSTRELAESHLSRDGSRYAEDLIAKEKSDRLTDDEHRYLERAMQVEHLMRLVKKEAMRLLRNEPQPIAAAAPARSGSPAGELAAV